jgi:hypothetical protein
MSDAPTAKTRIRRMTAGEYFVFLCSLLVTASLAFICSPLLIHVWIRHAIDERAQRRRLAAEGRLIAWDAARERVRGGDGILIVEMHPPQGYGHTWWVDAGHLLGHPPCPLPEFREPQEIELYKRLVSEPIGDWCYDHLTPLMQTASRLEGRMPAGFEEGLPPERVRVVWESWDQPRVRPGKFTPTPMAPLKEDL